MILLWVFLLARKAVVVVPEGRGDVVIRRCEELGPLPSISEETGARSSTGRLPGRDAKVGLTATANCVHPSAVIEL
jgi:hypothetical protein